MKNLLLWEMSAFEIAKSLEEGIERVIVPCGSFEQHGFHLPVSTDTLCALEIAKKVASLTNSLVAPPLFWGLSYPHLGFKGVIDLSLETYLGLVRDLAINLSRNGFKKIVFLNGHYDNIYALLYALREAHVSLSPKTIAYAVSYWEGLSPEDSKTFNEEGRGLHAGAGETSLLLAIAPHLVNLELAEQEYFNFPPITTNYQAVHLAYFLTHPGSLFKATKSGVWGDPHQASREKGEKLIQKLAESCTRLIIEIEETFNSLPK